MLSFIGGLFVILFCLLLGFVFLKGVMLVGVLVKGLNLYFNTELESEDLRIVRTFLSIKDKYRLTITQLLDYEKSLRDIQKNY